MDSDKILISVALVIVLSGFAFRDKIADEIMLFRQLDNGAIVENFVNEMATSYYYPLTQSQRIEDLQGHVAKINDLQKQISESMFARYFVDFREYIIERQHDILELQQAVNEDGELITFATRNSHPLISTTEFSNEELLKLAALIDKKFPEEDGIALYAHYSENGDIALEMALQDDFHAAEKQHYQKFVDSVSKEIFKGKAVSLQISDLDSEDKEIFQSKS